MKAGQVPRQWTVEFLIEKVWCRMVENKSTVKIHIWVGEEGGGCEYIGEGWENSGWVQGNGLTDLFS